MGTRQAQTQQTPPPPQAPPPGWYPNPEGPGQRYWDGAQWSEYSPPVVEQPGEPREQRAAYIHNARYQVASAIMGLATVGLMALFIVNLGHLGEHTGKGGSDVFYLAAGPAKFVAPGLGFLLVPALIAFLMLFFLERGGYRLPPPPGQGPGGPALVQAFPLFVTRKTLQGIDRSAKVKFRYAGSGWAFPLILSVLFVGGMVNLVAVLTGLGNAYAIKPGTYMAAGLLCAGLCGALGMLPLGLERALVRKAR